MLQKLDPVVAEFREWLTGKTGTYNYLHGKECAFAQFLRDKHGDKANIIVSAFHYDTNVECGVIPSPLQAQLRIGNFDKLRDLIDTGALF